MSQFSCDVCAFESFDSYNATVWAAQNPWFQNYSSLAGALGDQQIREVSRHTTAPVAEYGGPDPVPGPSTGGNSSNDDSDDPEAVVNFHGKVPIFCRVGDCRYWNDTLKLVKRHRNGHFPGRFGYLCPNKMGTCPSRRSYFKRRDAVNAHCRRYADCREMLKANGGRVEHWGTPPNEEDLVPYDPAFHRPYRKFYGQAEGD